MTIQDQIDELQDQIQRLEAQQHRCPHVWEEVKYEPIVHEAHRALDYMGPIREGQPVREVDVPREEIPRWSRRCSACGLVEYTKLTEEVQVRGKIPGTKATQQHPVFPGRRS